MREPTPRRPRVLLVDDNRALVEEEYWQRAVTDLVTGAPAAIVFAFIALFIDLMIVFFAFMAGEGQAGRSGARLPVGHWLSLAYRDDLEVGVRGWLSALDGVRLQRGRTIYHRLDLRRVRGDDAAQAGRFLRQDGYLQQILMEDGVGRWCLTDLGYAGLVDLARGLEGPTGIAEARVSGAPTSDAPGEGKLAAP